MSDAEENKRKTCQSGLPKKFLIFKLLFREIKIEIFSKGVLRNKNESFLQKKLNKNELKMSKINFRNFFSKCKVVNYISFCHFNFAKVFVSKRCEQKPLSKFKFFTSFYLFIYFLKALSKTLSEFRAIKISIKHIWLRGILGIQRIMNKMPHLNYVYLKLGF